MRVAGTSRWAALWLGLCCVTGAVAGDDVSTAAHDANAFALDLYAQIAADESVNVFFSPASVSTALTMAYAGARGETATEMAAALRLSLEGKALHRASGELARLLQSDRSGLKLSIANALWGQAGYPFRQEYLALGAEHYGAALQQVDFISQTEREARRRSNYEDLARE